jgi:transcriptional regulator with XRE-family HTH domain
MEKIRITVAAARVNAGMTQQELAVALGVSASTIKNWEGGKTSPDLKRLRRLGELSGIPIDYIFLPDTLLKVDLPHDLTPEWRW